MLHINVSDIGDMFMSFPPPPPNKRSTIQSFYMVMVVNIRFLPKTATFSLHMYSHYMYIPTLHVLQGVIRQLEQGIILISEWLTQYSVHHDAIYHIGRRNEANIWAN